MVDVTTCKFVGDASLNNDSFTHCVTMVIRSYNHVCDLLAFANINNRENLQLPLDTQKLTLTISGDVTYPAITIIDHAYAADVDLNSYALTDAGVDCSTTCDGSKFQFPTVLRGPD